MATTTIRISQEARSNLRKSPDYRSRRSSTTRSMRTDESISLRLLTRRMIALERSRGSCGRAGGARAA